MNDADNTDAIGAGAVELSLQPPQGFSNGWQTGFEVEVAHGGPAGTGTGGGALRCFAKRADGGVGGDGFAAGFTDFHEVAGAGGGTKMARRRRRT